MSFQQKQEAAEDDDPAEEGQDQDRAEGHAQQGRLHEDQPKVRMLQGGGRLAQSKDQESKEKYHGMGTNLETLSVVFQDRLRNVGFLILTWWRP